MCNYSKYLPHTTSQSLVPSQPPISVSIEMKKKSTNDAEKYYKLYDLNNIKYNC